MSHRIKELTDCTSEFEDSIYSYYRDLKDGRDSVRLSDDLFQCPYCYEYEKKEYTYKRILGHASRVGRESKSASSRSRARHLALERYLERHLHVTDIISQSRTEHHIKDNGEKQISLPSIPMESVEHGPQSNSCNRTVEHRKHEAIEDLIVYPWAVIIANIPVVLKEGRYVGDSGKKMKDEWILQGYKPTKVHPLWNYKGHTGFAIAEFNNDWTGFDNALTFTKHFEMDNHGKRDWQRARQKGEKLYAWIAREEEYHRKDKMGDYLRKNADLLTISDIETGNKIKEKRLVSNLTNSLDMKDKECEKIQTNISKTEAQMLNVMKQKDHMVEVYNNELEKMQQEQHCMLEGVYRGLEQTKSKLEAEREQLRLKEYGLKTREYLNENERRRLDHMKKMNDRAILEQKKVEESTKKLVESHQREKQLQHQRIIELQKNLDDKQRLELQIEQLKGAVEVTRHISEDGDVEAKKRMEALEESLKENEEDLEGLDDLNQALIIKERRTNDELQDARKELINGLKNRSTLKAFIGVKVMGCLDSKPIISAAKNKYPASEAGVKADEFFSVIDAKLRDPNWHPFKGIMIGEERREIINEEDECLKAAKNDWGDEIYKAVVTALTEMNDYNPSGRYPVPQLWNFKEGRRATLSECADVVLKQWKTNKRKRT